MTKVKIAGSHTLIVSCGHCKTSLLSYQKVGKGRLLRLYLERINFSDTPLQQELICPNCGELIALLATTKAKSFYKMKRGKYNIKRIND